MTPNDRLVPLATPAPIDPAAPEMHLDNRPDFDHRQPSWTKIGQIDQSWPASGHFFPEIRDIGLNSAKPIPMLTKSGAISANFGPTWARNRFAQTRPKLAHGRRACAAAALRQPARFRNTNSECTAGGPSLAAPAGSAAAHCILTKWHTLKIAIHRTMIYLTPRAWPRGRERAKHSGFPASRDNARQNGK